MVGKQAAKHKEEQPELTLLGKYLSSVRGHKDLILSGNGITEGRLETLCIKPTALFYGDEFFYIITQIGKSIDHACKAIFGHLKMTDYKKEIGNSIKLSKLGNYIEQFTVEQRDIAYKAGIEHTRFNKLIKNNNRRPYAYEIYLLALAMKKKPSEIFEELYGAKIVNKQINNI